MSFQAEYNYLFRIDFVSKNLIFLNPLRLVLQKFPSGNFPIFGVRSVRSKTQHPQLDYAARVKSATDQMFAKLFDWIN